MIVPSPRQRPALKPIRLNLYLDPGTFARLQAVGQLRNLKDGGAARELILFALDHQYPQPNGQKETA